MTALDPEITITGLRARVADIRPLPEPIPTSGALNLWPLGGTLERRVLAAVGVPGAPPIRERT